MIELRWIPNKQNYASKNILQFRTKLIEQKKEITYSEVWGDWCNVPHVDIYAAKEK